MAHRRRYVVRRSKWATSPGRRKRSDGRQHGRHRRAELGAAGMLSTVNRLGHVRFVPRFRRVRAKLRARELHRTPRASWLSCPCSRRSFSIRNDRKVPSEGSSDRTRRRRADDRAKGPDFGGVWAASTVFEFAIIESALFFDGKSYSMRKQRLIILQRDNWRLGRASRRLFHSVLNTQH